MSIINKATIKLRFENGDIPNQDDFVNLIDSGNVPLVSNMGNASSTISTDASTGDIFEITVVSDTTLSKPTNGINGKTVTWLMKQSNGGSHIITLDTSFVIPSSATTPLSWSTTNGLTDVFVAKYIASSDKWMVVGMVPGYSL